MLMYVRVQVVPMKCCCCICSVIGIVPVISQHVCIAVCCNSSLIIIKNRSFFVSPFYWYLL